MRYQKIKFFVLLNLFNFSYHIYYDLQRHDDVIKASLFLKSCANVINPQVSLCAHVKKTTITPSNRQFDNDYLSKFFIIKYYHYYSHKYKLIFL